MKEIRQKSRIYHEAKTTTITNTKKTATIPIPCWSYLLYIVFYVLVLTFFVSQAHFGHIFVLFLSFICILLFTKFACCVVIRLVCVKRRSRTRTIGNINGRERERYSVPFGSSQEFQNYTIYQYNGNAIQSSNRRVHERRSNE